MGIVSFEKKIGYFPLRNFRLLEFENITPSYYPIFAPLPFKWSGRKVKTKENLRLLVFSS